MVDSRIERSDYIADAKKHNEWWDGELSDLSDVASYDPRSDFLQVLRRIDTHRREGVESLVYPIYGPTGIGKTTLLKQFIAAVVSEDNYSPGHRDLDIFGAVDPRQILYVPLEESLYHLERAEDAVEQLYSVIDYFRTHVAPRGEISYVLLDDIGALRLDEDQKQKLFEIVDDRTYLLLTGIVRSQVDVEDVPGSERIDEVEWARPMLPMKFADTVQLNLYDETSLEEAEPELVDRIESLRTSSVEGESLIREVRSHLSSPAELPTAVEALNQLYFEVLSAHERDLLHEAAREYLQRGGFFRRVDDSAVENELTRSHLLLYLYKELARYESIQHPENLHRLSSLAASHAGEELRYTDISDQLELNRRTLDSYLKILDEGLSVSESHDFSLQRHRRTRLYLRNPRHVVLLSQRQEHYGFEGGDPTRVLNHEFEYKLARTVAFDHAKRLAYAVDPTGGGDHEVEYCETDAGTVDYILRNEGFVLPFVLSYHPNSKDAEAIVAAFDPTAGKHPKPDTEDLQNFDYEAPYRFIVTDSLPQEVKKSESLVRDQGETKHCYLPYWLFLLIC